MTAELPSPLVRGVSPLGGAIQVDRFLLCTNNFGVFNLNVSVPVAPATHFRHISHFREPLRLS